jgi:hypothetical protein
MRKSLSHDFALNSLSAYSKAGNYALLGEAFWPSRDATNKSELQSHTFAPESKVIHATD